MQLGPRRSIEQKLSLILTILIVGIVVISGIITYERDRRELITIFYNRLAGFTRMTALLCEEEIPQNVDINTLETKTKILHLFQRIQASIESPVDFYLLQPTNQELRVILSNTDSKTPHIISQKGIQELQVGNVYIVEDKTTNSVAAYVTFFNPNSANLYGVIGLREYTLNLDAELARKQIFMIIFVMGWSIFGWIISIIASKSHTTSIRNLAQDASVLMQGNYSQPIAKTTDDEIGLVAEILEQMRINLNQKINQYETLNQQLEQKVQERTIRLQEINRKLTHANTVKSRFIASASHELHTPLNSIIGYSQMLRDGVYGELNETQKKALDSALDSGKQLLELINDLLDISRLESGKFTINRAYFPVRFAVLDVLAQLENQISQQNLTIKYDLPPPEFKIYADELRFKQIFTNLLTNAIKFNRPEGECSIKYKLLKDRILFSVSDTGIGIESTKFTSIFAEFERTNESHRIKGTGLGLSLVKHLVELHGGEVTVESQVGVGSTFSFTIPIIIAEEAY